MPQRAASGEQPELEGRRSYFLGLLKKYFKLGRERFEVFMSGNVNLEMHERYERSPNFRWPRRRVFSLRFVRKMFWNSRRRGFFFFKNGHPTPWDGKKPDLWSVLQESNFQQFFVRVLLFFVSLLSIVVFGRFQWFHPQTGKNISPSPPWRILTPSL